MIYSGCHFKIKAFPLQRALSLLKEMYSSGVSGLGFDNLKATDKHKGNCLIGIWCNDMRV